MTEALIYVIYDNLSKTFHNELTMTLFFERIPRLDKLSHDSCVTKRKVGVIYNRSDYMTI